MTAYIAIAQEYEDWQNTFEFSYDQPSLAQAAIVALSELPPDWELVSVQLAEYADRQAVRGESP